MGSGIFNIAIGGLLVVASLGIFGQRFTLIGTSSWEALFAVGIAIACLGAYQVWKYTRKK